MMISISKTIYVHPEEIQEPPPIPIDEGEWVSKKGDSFWDCSSGSWNGVKWNSEYIEFGNYHLIYLQVAGGWQIGYRPAKIRVSCDKMIDRLQMLPELSPSGGLAMKLYYFPGEALNIDWSCGGYAPNEDQNISTLQFVCDSAFSITNIEFYEEA